MSDTPRTVCLVTDGDRFEDFFDKIGVSLETFRRQFTGGWLFNYVEALGLVGVRTVLVFASARVDHAVQFTHEESGAPMWILPSPRLHKKLRNGQRRYFPDSITLPALTSYFALPLRAFTRIIREERCDAILCQEYESARFDACVLLGRLLGLPVFATYQGANKRRTALERPIRHLSVRWSRGLVIPSGDEVMRVRRDYGVPLRKIAAIPNPVEVVPDLGGDRNTIRSKLGIHTNTVVLAWHGRVQIAKKGLDVLLDAWDRICRDRPEADILLLIVGTGRDARVFGERLEPRGKVLWIDRYVFDRQELWSYLAAADVYTIPSRYEGFAVAVLEAMACGLPVVASDAEGVVDAFRRGEADGALIVPRGDASALAGAIVRLLDDPALRQRFADVVRRRIETEFSLDVIGPRLRDFLFPADQGRGAAQ